LSYGPGLVGSDCSTSSIIVARSGGYASRLGPCWDAESSVIQNAGRRLLRLAMVKLCILAAALPQGREESLRRWQIARVCQHFGRRRRRRFHPHNHLGMLLAGEYQGWTICIWRNGCAGTRRETYNHAEQRAWGEGLRVVPENTFRQEQKQWPADMRAKSCGLT